MTTEEVNDEVKIVVQCDGNTILPGTAVLLCAPCDFDSLVTHFKNWNARKEENAAIKSRLESAETALEAIASYDMYSGEIGICQYGCDTPNIAREHFKKYEKESV